MAHSHKKKKDQEREKEQEAPTSCDMKTKSFRFYYLGMVVWFSVRAKIWIRAHALARIGLKLHGYEMRKGYVSVLFYYMPTICEYVHSHHPQISWLSTQFNVLPTRL